MRRRGESGFTLFEVVLATLLASLVFLAVAVALSSFGGAWERGERRYAAREGTWLIWSRLEAELASLVRGPFGLGPSFRGDREGFRFTAAGDEGPQAVSVHSAEGRLVLEINHLRRPEEDRPERIVLAEGVERLSFSYWDPEARTWRADWPEDRGRPPSLVRMEISLRPGRSTARSLPPFIFPVYVGRVFAEGEVDPLE